LASAVNASSTAQAADQLLIDAAKKEAQVNWYTTQIITQFARPAAEAFLKKYGIKVIPLRGGSSELAIKLINEHKAGRVQADVFDGTSTTAAVKPFGVVLKWQPDSAKELPSEFRDAEGYWVANNAFVHTPAFNTNLVPRGTEPRTWHDLLDPKWKGKMAWTSHATSAGAPGFIGIVLRELGDEEGRAYLRALAKQEIVRIGGSSRSVTDQAIAGEYPIVLQIFNHQPFISAQKGAPIDWIPMSPAMAVLSVASVAAGAPHPNAAKLFVEFLISEEGQELFRDHGYIPIAPSISPKEPRLRPDGKLFRGIFFTPEEIEKSLPKWVSIYEDVFR
jgi:iron(III) transport system substrate-binding protein